MRGVELVAERHSRVELVAGARRRRLVMALLCGTVLSTSFVIDAFADGGAGSAGFFIGGTGGVDSPTGPGGDGGDPQSLSGAAAVVAVPAPPAAWRNGRRRCRRRFWRTDSRGLRREWQRRRCRRRWWRRRWRPWLRGCGASRELRRLAATAATAATAPGRARGGGGAGGYGAVATGTGNLGTLGFAATGGNGGNGGNGVVLAATPEPAASAFCSPIAPRPASMPRLREAMVARVAIAAGISRWQRRRRRRRHLRLEPEHHLGSCRHDQPGATGARAARAARSGGGGGAGGAGIRCQQ